jgi:hypothetical protein
MITAADYLAITHEQAPPDFEALRAAVIARLEAALDRRLVNATRTEYVVVYADGIAFPLALPITSAGDLAHDTVAIYTQQRGNGRPVQVTYVGGFTPYGALEGPTLPYPLAAAIAWGVRTLAVGPTPPVPMGVASMSVAGEFAVSVAAGTILGADGEPVPAQLAELADLGGRCATLASSYRRVV